MIETAVLNNQGAEVEKFSFDEDVLGGKVRKRLLKQAVVMYLANKRQGDACVKSRGEVAGSTRKLYRQKGTGRARIGTKKVPHRKGGGVAFGPKPRDFGRDMPRKAKRVATRSALLSKFMDGQVMLVDQLVLPEVKTRAMVAILKSLGITRSCLLVVADHATGADFVRAGRNIPGLTVIAASDLNAYEVLKNKTVLMGRDVAQSLTGSEVTS